MQVFKQESKLEQAVQEVEVLMDKLGLKLSCNDGMVFTLKDNKWAAAVKDTESGEQGWELPRVFDSEKLVLVED